MSRESRYLLLFVTVTVGCLAATAFLNYTIDVRGIYAAKTDAFRGYIRSYVARLVASPHGLTFIPFERAIKAELARVANGDCYVTGSSQTMGIDIDSFPVSQQFKCSTIVNLAVSGGSYEDFLISAGILANRQNAATLFVGVAPWMLRSFAEVGWIVEADQFNRSRRALGLAPAEQHGGSFEQKAANLFSGSYLRRNIAFLIEQRGFSPPTVKEASAEITETIYRPSGSTRAPPRTTLTSPTGSTDFSYKIAVPFVDPRLTLELQRVIVALNRLHMRVVLLIVPYHEAAFKCRSSMVCDALRAVEAGLWRIAEANDLSIVGGYDPRPFQLVDDDFIDVLHLKPDGLKKLRRVR